MIPAGKGDPIWFSGNRMTIKRAPGMSWTFIESRLHPGHAPPLHFHHDEDEAFYLIGGTMRFRRGDEEFDAGPGAFVFVPRGTQHAFRVGECGAIALQVATGTALAAFIEAAGEPAAGPGLPLAAGLDRDAIAREAANHDMTVIGPPLS